MARKFLYIIAALITLVILGGFMIRLYADELTNLAFVPTAKFEQQVALKTSIYDDVTMWYSRGGVGANNPTRWQPTGAPVDEIKGSAAIFFVHPTSFISRDRWNAELDDQETTERDRKSVV